MDAVWWSYDGYLTYLSSKSAMYTLAPLFRPFITIFRSTGLWGFSCSFLSCKYSPTLHSPGDFYPPVLQIADNLQVPCVMNEG